MDYGRLQEIRLRIGYPVLFIYDNEEQLLGKEGGLTREKQKGYCVTKSEFRETMEYICNYSMYAFEEELRQGFLTIQGGHRVGVGGKVILEKDRVKNIKYISCINIRLAHEIKGCADELMPFLWERQMGRWRHTLVVSPPRCGKTTLLRDMVRYISEGSKEKQIKGLNVGVVDERSELGACYLGVPQNDLGMRTDILDCCPKEEGIMMLVRSMSPAVIAVDEIGSQRERAALEQAVNCGCVVFATAHGATLPDIQKRGLACFFERFVLLRAKGRVGEIEGIYDKGGQKVC